MSIKNRGGKAATLENPFSLPTIATKMWQEEGKKIKVS